MDALHHAPLIDNDRLVHCQQRAIKDADFNLLPYNLRLMIKTVMTRVVPTLGLLATLGLFIRPQSPPSAPPS